MDSNTNFSSKSWCAECRRYIADPNEVGAESDGVCPHYGWALVKTDAQDTLADSEVMPEPELPAQPEEVSPAKKEKPILGEGRGIAAQSAVQFSHEREEAIKSDPLVHRQKDAGMMGTLVGVMLGLCAVVAIFIFFPQGNTVTDGGVSPVSVDSKVGAGSVVSLKEDVIKFVNEVSQIDDAEKLLKVIRFPELLEPVVRARHESLGTDFSLLDELSVLSYSDNVIYGSRFASLSMGGVDGEIAGYVLVEITDDGKMLLDWEVLVGAIQRYWSEFESKKPTEAVPLWVSMHRTSTFDLPLPEGEDPAQWIALKVMNPASGVRGTVFLTLVKKGDAFGDYVEKYIPWNTEAPNGRTMAVKARFTDGSSPTLIIDEFCAPGAYRSPVDDAVYPLKNW